MNKSTASKIFLSTLSPLAFAASSLAFAADSAASAPVAVHPLNLILGLLFLLAIVVAGWWLVQRAGGLQIKSGSGMRIVTAISVGPRERVVLIEIAGEQMLLGVAPGRVNLLHRFEQPVMAASSDDFASKIRQVMQQGLNK
ncbi:MAG: flagellar biosynthetic protein FliO [Spongiibacteraceae bacterium]